MRFINCLESALRKLLVLQDVSLLLPCLGAWKGQTVPSGLTTLASLPNIGIYNVYVNVSIVDGPPSKTGWSIVENVGIDTTEHDYVQRITYLIDGVSYVRGMNNKTALSSWERVYGSSILTDSTVLSPLASALGAAAWIQGTNIVPNGTLTIGANAYRPVIVREVSVEGVSAILFGEYNSNSFTAYKSPKFDQVLSVSMAVGGAYTITNISGRATTIFYYVI